MNRRLIVLSLYVFSLQLAMAQVPCISGKAGEYPCNQITLLSHLSAEDLLGVDKDLNDLWGWEDPESSKEYAIVGLTDGVTFVDVTDPVQPIVIGKLKESHLQSGRILHGESAWRDIKVYKNHAYIVSDGNSDHGMQVFDLTKLREYDGTALDFEQDGFYDGIGSSHNIVINEETGFAYIVGARGATVCGQGGMHILDISDPKNPVYEACFDNDGYTHDAQCVIYRGPDSKYNGQEICFNSNEDTFTIVNVDDKSNMDMISRLTYSEVQYTHQGWLTEDHKYFLMNDELDEGEFRFNPRTLIWNIEELDNPILIGSFYNEVSAIDHNLYTKGDLVFESNYGSGLRVLSSERISEGVLREVAFFDTHPQRNVIAFEGSWSNYPYFKSGNIIVSDLFNGLFIVRLDTTDFIVNHPTDVQSFLGDNTTMTIETKENAANYEWQDYKSQTRMFLPLTEGDFFRNVSTASLSIKLDQNIEGKLLRCKVTSPAGNIYYSYSAIIDIEGVEPLSSPSLEAFNLYPNPTSNYIGVTVRQPANYQIIDFAGKIILEGYLKEGKNEITISSLRTGQYIFHGQHTDSQTFNGKFIKN
ncbi:MAG: choice-of-anchor B family protein [Cyclobacteriaceae bacterium]